MSRDYGSRPFGNYAKWDMVKGRELWIAGLKVAEIADALTTLDHLVTPKAVLGAAMRYDWPSRKRQPNVKKCPSPSLMRCSECFAKYGTSETHDCHGRAVALRASNGWAA